MSSEERAQGWTETLVPELSDALDAIAARLRAGEYLWHDDWLAWDDPLGDAGLERRLLTGISYIDRERRRLGMNIDFIESCRAGPCGSAYARLIINFTGTEFSGYRARSDRRNLAIVW